MEKGDIVAINFENGIVAHEGNAYHFPALPMEVLAILEDGGLIPREERAREEHLAEAFVQDNERLLVSRGAFVFSEKFRVRILPRDPGSVSSLPSAQACHASSCRGESEGSPRPADDAASVRGE